VPPEPPKAPPRQSWTTSLWQRLWRQPIVKRAFYEFLGVILVRKGGLQMLNCGYQEAEGSRIDLPPLHEKERLGCQLYRRVAGSLALAGADIIEVGCGRAGGARFLTDGFGPRRYVATDFSRLFLLTNRLTRHPPVLQFQFARAHRMPFEADSFDFGIAVEAVHAMPDKAAFLAEMARILKPGGKLLVADFFYVRESSPNSLAGFRAKADRAGFVTEREEDWTGPARAALEADSPRRFAEIDRLPRVFRQPALSFAGTTESPLYRQLCDGRALYAYFALSAPQS
jgi:SAM-dependent methyltransferase